MAYDFLMTIEPTSVESERTFFPAGLFCIIINSQLRDKNIRKLCFL